MKSYDKPYLSEKKYIKNQVETLSGERLAFLGEDPPVCRKVRRILEKRVSQRFWKKASPGKEAGNRARFETRHQLSNHYRIIYGLVPEEYRLSA